MATTKTIKTKKKTMEVAPDPVQAVASSGEVNEFADPSAALVPGSEMQLAVLSGNQLEAPEENQEEHDPKADEARTSLKSLLQGQEEHFYSIARNLSYISSNKSFKQWGYKTFEECLEKDFKLAKRKGFFYTQVYNYFEQNVREGLKSNPRLFDALMNTIREVGWTKGRLLARFRIVTNENVEEVTEKLRDLTTREFEMYAKVVFDAMKGKDKDDAEENNFVRRSFQLSLAQVDSLDRALALAETIINKETKPSSCLALIAADFVETHKASMGKASGEGLADMMSHYARLWDVDIVVVDSKTKQVVYGQDTLELLSK